MRLTFRYRLYPTSSQIQKLEKTLNKCRFLYNCALKERRSAYRLSKISRSYKKQAGLLKKIKEIFPEYKEVHSQVLQSTLKRVDSAYKFFFEKGSGFPRFKNKDRFRSFLYPQTGFALKEQSNSFARLFVSKIGHIKMTYFRPIKGQIKTCQITKTSTEKWYVCLSCVEVPLEPQRKTNESIGIDLGVKTYVTISDGETIGNPKHFNKSRAKLALAQRKLDKLDYKNPKRHAAKRHVARLHEKIKHQREDFQHKKSLELVKRYDIICMEDLDIKEMISKSNKISKSLNGAIEDCAWGNFVNKISFKAERANKRFYKVPPRNTSTMCSSCGKKVSKDLSVRIHKCECGLEIDRDLNASYNILNLGMELHMRYASSSMFRKSREVLFE